MLQNLSIMKLFWFSYKQKDSSVIIQFNSVEVLFWSDCQCSQIVITEYKGQIY